MPPRKKVDTMRNDRKQEYINKYLETYSVTQVINAFDYGDGRKPIEDVLKEAGVYEGTSGTNYLEKKVENNKKVMMEKYGVDNISKLKENWTARNSIPYEKLPIGTKFTEYRESVTKLTKKNLRKVTPPNKCYYTGIEFADSKGEANPNDPRKRSVDHIKPVLYCFVEGVSVEDAASLNNIRYVLKYINNIKGNTSHESFLPLVDKIKEMMYEG